MRARVLALAVVVTAAVPAGAQAVVAVTGSSSRLQAGVAVTVKNTGDEEIRFLRLLFGAPFTVTPQTAPCQSGGPGEVFCPLATGALKPGGELTVQNDVSPLFPDGTPIAGRASADGEADVQFSVPGPGPGPGPAAGAPDIAVDLTGPASTTPGATVRYRLTIKNVGSAPSRGGSVEVSILPGGGLYSDFDSNSITPSAGSVFSSPDSDGGGLYHGLTVSFPALAPGQSRVTEFDVVIDGVAAPLQGIGLLAFDDIGTRTLTAALAGADPEPGPNSDAALTRFEIREPAIDSTIGKPTGAPREIAGTASGNVAGVKVAVVKATGGAKAAAASCRWLASKRATFRRTPASAGRCRTPIWLQAQGTKRWKLRLSRPLPRGTYTVYSRAITKDGAPEVRFSAKDGNRLPLTVR